MRVISGIAKGIPLKAPKGDSVRPTVDRLKETLFNMIQAETYQAKVLDLFAGSGALGIEALSRGAELACFSEKDPKALIVLKDNLNKTGLSEKAIVYSGDYTFNLKKIREQNWQFDLVFLDPPYHQTDYYQESLDFLVCHQMLTQGALIIAETISGLDFSFIKKYDTITIEKLKNFKTNQYIFMRNGNGA